MGVTLNTVQGAVIRFGQPKPCPNFCSYGLHFITEGRDRFDLSSFPPNLSPSGGASCIISESEMMAMQIDIRGEVNDSGVASLWRDGEKLVEEIALPDSEGDHSYDVVFFGRFEGEIDRQGHYIILVSYLSGDVLLEFEVT